MTRAHARTRARASVRARWRPVHRRLTGAAPAALAPLLACGLALGGLTAWVGTGRTDSPESRVAVSYGQVFLPYGGTKETAAFFSIANTGDQDDRLVGVTSSGRKAGLSRHRMTARGAAYRQEVASAAVPTGTGLSMSPHGVAATVRSQPGWRPGDLVRFTLRFEGGATVDAVAVAKWPTSE